MVGKQHIEKESERHYNSRLENLNERQEKHKHIWKYTMKWSLKKQFGGVEWIYLAQDMAQCCTDARINAIKHSEIHEWLIFCQLLKNESDVWTYLHI